MVGLQRQDGEIAVRGLLIVGQLDWLGQKFGIANRLALGGESAEENAQRIVTAQQTDGLGTAAVAFVAPHQVGGVLVVQMRMGEENPLDLREVDLERGGLKEGVGAEIHQRVVVNEIGCAAAHIARVALATDLLAVLAVAEDGGMR